MVAFKVVAFSTDKQEGKVVALALTTIRLHRRALPESLQTESSLETEGSSSTEVPPYLSPMYQDLIDRFSLSLNWVKPYLPALAL